jgi:hypothetical protein
MAATDPPHAGSPESDASAMVADTVAGEENVATIFLDPGETMDALAALDGVGGFHRRLLVSDLSPQVKDAAALPGVVGKLRAAGWRVEWRDHHARQWTPEVVRGLEAVAVVRVDLAGVECASTLVQQDLLPSDPFARELASVARDHDLWILKDARSMRFEGAVRGMGSAAYSQRVARERRLDDPVLARAADAAEERKRAGIAWGLARAHIHRIPERAATGSAEGGGEPRVEPLGAAPAQGALGPGSVVRVGSAYGNVPTNEVLHAMIADHGCAVAGLFKPDGKFSLRSRKGVEVCHVVAQAFGGGGHPNAAGGKLPLHAGSYPAFWLRRDLHPLPRKVMTMAAHAVRDMSRGDAPNPSRAHM